MNNHQFHLVSASPWPFILAMNLVNLGLSAVLCLSSGGEWLFFFFFFFFFLLVMFQWWRDVVREGVYGGCHTHSSNFGFSLGIVSFVVSELFFFFSFFWMYFYFSLSPDISFGVCWPPLGMSGVDYLDLPFLNTLILLSSGFFVTWAHYSLSLGSSIFFNFSFLFSVLLGVYFLLVQGFEYYSLGFDFSSGSFGCSFYILTGFHGFHVLLGLLFLAVNYFRFFFYNFSSFSFFGFEYSIWYWHFVDLVWLFLYLFIYWWGM